MPLINVNTNLQDKDIPANFDRDLCKKIAEILQKPTEVSEELSLCGQLNKLITLNMRTGVRQIRKGTADPMISLEMYGLGVFDKTSNATYTPQVMQFVKEKLGLSADRVLLIYHSLQPHDVGKLASS